MNVFTVVCGGLLVFFAVATSALGLFSKRSALEVLDWKPTRSPELEEAKEADDVAQMIAAQNELRRRRGKPAGTQAEVEAQLARDQAALREWRPEGLPRAWRGS